MCVRLIKCFYLLPFSVVFIQESLNTSPIIGVHGHQVLHLQNHKKTSELSGIMFFS